MHDDCLPKCNERHQNREYTIGLRITAGPPYMQFLVFGVGRTPISQKQLTDYTRSPILGGDDSDVDVRIRSIFVTKYCGKNHQRTDN